MFRAADYDAGRMIIHMPANGGINWIHPALSIFGFGILGTVTQNNTPGGLRSPDSCGGENETEVP